MSEIRRYFTSRFNNGVLAEFDFSQLEIVALAQLSKDPVLIQELNEGVDIHRRNAAAWKKIPEHKVTPSLRKKAKSMSFQLQYGAGATSMAAKLGIHKEDATDFIRAYYTRYSAIAEWQQNLYADVTSSRVVTSAKTPKGFPVGIGHYELDTGRILTFKEKDAPSWMRGTDTAFAPTETKNYPVQSFATGDIVPLMLGIVAEKYMKTKYFRDGTALPVNTVHDSIVFDIMDLEVFDEFAPFILGILNNTDKYIKTFFDIDMVVSITADCKFGPNWEGMAEYVPR